MMPITRELSRLGGIVSACAAMAAPALAQEAEELWQADGFAMPESVLWDAGTKLFYVSNMGADPMAKDGDGFIATMDATGAVQDMAFATGARRAEGHGGVGRDALRLRHRQREGHRPRDRCRSPRPTWARGSPSSTTSTVGTDGTVYVSDTFGNAVYKVEGDGLALVARSADLAGANGLMPGPDGTLLVANLGDVSGGFENIVPGWVVSLDLASGAVAPYGATEPPGVLDGIAADGKGGVVLTDNAAGTVLHQMPGGAPEVIATIASGAADLDYDSAAGVIVVPITPEGRVVALKWSPM